MKYKTEVIIVLLIIFLTTSVSALNFYEQPNSTKGKDTWLKSGSPNQNFGINNKLQIKGSDNRRTIMEFDLSSIPSNAIIDSAKLELYLLNKGTKPIINVSLQRITHEWIEGTGDGVRTDDGATWNTYNGTDNWNAEGGDFDEFIYTITEVSSKDTWYSFDITNLVQSWINNTYENYGMIIRDMILNSGEWKFASSDNTNLSTHPKINITYTLPDSTPPSSITNLINISQGLDFIYWTWTNPTEPDFLENIIYLDNINIINTSNNFYNATSLSEDTEYTIKIHTIDTNSNINTADITNTARTLKTCVENWNCTDWNSCTNSTQTRTCTDQNLCGTELNKPEESQNCTENPGGGPSGGGGNSGTGPSTVYQTDKKTESTPQLSEQEPISNTNEQKNKQPGTQKSQETITSYTIKQPSFLNKNLKHIITAIMMIILAVYIFRKEVNK